MSDRRVLAAPRLDSLIPAKRRAPASIWCLVAVGVVSGGCATRQDAYTRTVQGPDVARTEALTRAQYEVLGRTVGEACAQSYALWPIPVWWTTGDDQALATDDAFVRSLPCGAAQKAARSAAYKALAAMPNADALLAPRATVVSQVSRGWYTKSCVRVVAKGLRIKTDAELDPGTLAERPRSLETIVRPGGQP